MDHGRPPCRRRGRPATASGAGRGYDDRVTDPNQDPASRPTATPPRPSRRHPASAASRTRRRTAIASPRRAPRRRTAATRARRSRAASPSRSWPRASAPSRSSILGGVLTVTAGLVVVAAAIGWGVGAGARFGAGAHLPPRRRVVDRGRPRRRRRSRSGRLGLWQYARTEGGVLAPLDYLGRGLRAARPAPVRRRPRSSAWVGAR